MEVFASLQRKTTQFLNDLLALRSAAGSQPVTRDQRGASTLSTLHRVC